MTGPRASLLLAASLALAGGCSSMQRPEIRGVRPHITGIDLQGVNLAFDVDIHNPYPIAMRTPRFLYGIDIEGSEFIKSQAPVAIDVPAGQIGTAKLPARLEYAQLWSTYRSLASAKEVRYHLHGTVPVSVLGQTHDLALAHDGVFPVLRLPTIDVDDVDFSDVSLSKAKTTVAATLRNPNAFALGAKDLGYALIVDEIPVGRVSANTLESIPAGGTGRLQLNGEITARSLLTRILQGGGFSNAKVSANGTLETPFGPEKLER
jgi:LEA14-like dessication related protein